MAMLFLNLPVKDLPASREFFSKLGFAFNDEFSDDKAASLVLGSDAYVMLLTEEFFSTFTGKSLADAAKSTEMIAAIGVDSRQRVDEIVDIALAAGGRASQETSEQEGMYGRSFQDLDGHLWEVVYMGS